mgnify:CR=1 FL=1
MAPFRQPPNPSVERTANGGARLPAPAMSVAPSAAAHLKLQGLPYKGFPRFSKRFSNFYCLIVVLPQ